MLRRLVHDVDALRESGWLSAYMGCIEAWDGQFDQSDLAELDFSDIRHPRRCDGEDLDLSLALTHYARYWVDVATDLPVDRNYCHHELRCHLMFAVDLHAMPSTPTLVGSSDRRHMH